MSTATKYERINAKEIPTAVRFDVPRPNQGQIIEVAYGGFSRYEHDDGAEYMRRLDRSIGPDAYEYYRLAK
jgi:hypothetical protein